LVKQISMTQLRFIESTDIGYAGRTFENASADATIAIAIDFSTAGEKLTKKSVLAQGKAYIPIDGHDLTLTPERIAKLVERLNRAKAKTINIAGNGLYTLNKKYTQSQVDAFTYSLLKGVIESPDLAVQPSLIRSGGQTGIDEAGIKAAIRLNIPALVLAPKKWLFRTANGVDIANEGMFKIRFIEE